MNIGDTTPVKGSTRVPSLQQHVEDALAVVLLPSFALLVMHSILILFISDSLIAIGILHALFSIVVAIRAFSHTLSWQHGSQAIGGAGLCVTVVGGILLLIQSFSAIHFFGLLTEPFILATLDALVAGIVLLLMPTIQQLYQK